MKEKLKVLMVVFNLQVTNGVSSFVMNYFRTIDHQRVQIDFAIYSDIPTPYYKEIKEAGSKVYVLPSVKKIKKHLVSCKKIIAEGHYDIVHDNILILSIGLMYYAKKLGVPVRILHSHSAKLGELKIKALRNAILLPFLKYESTDYVACSRAASHGMFGDHPSIILPNVVSAEKLTFDNQVREKVREKLKIQDKFVVGLVGRLAPQKNPYYAIDVIVETKKLIPNMEFLWIGTGPLERKIKQYVQDRMANRYIRFLGSRTDVNELYQALDLFFLPSNFEGLPVTGLEAQATGLPCLVSDRISDEFVYTKNLVKFFSIKQNTEKTADMILAIYNTFRKDERKSCHQELLQSHFCDNDAGKRLTNMYEMLLERRGIDYGYRNN